MLIVGRKCHTNNILKITTENSGLKTVIVAYYTPEYAGEAKEFLSLLSAFNCSVFCVAVPNQGGWDANTHYKPTFIKQCLELFKKPIVYLDVDSRVLEDPTLFDNIEEDCAFYFLNKVHQQRELVSATMYFKYNDRVLNMVDKWIDACKVVTDTKWEQTKLQELVDLVSVYELPVEYCGIFDNRVVQGKRLVIRQEQASRRLKQKEKKHG